MSKILKKAISLILMLAMVLAMVPAAPVSAATVNNVGSLWDGFTSGSGTFTVTESSRVFVVGTSAPEGDLLQTAQLIQRELRAQFGESYFAEMVWGPESYAWTGDVVLKLDTSSGTGADGYKLDVNATTATITAADTDGLIYGANNLMKCFRAVGGNTISCFSGNDSPDTAERTVSLDCGRKYLSAEWIKNFIRQMSWMGYNTLQLHFSDDGGFRIDLWDPEYFTSANGNDFSWLAGSHIQSWVKNGNANDEDYDYRTDTHANYYLTAAELVEICNVAKEYHIEIIPSFDSPAHMDYITWKFEQNYKSNTSYSFTYGGQDWYASKTSGCINYTGKTGASSPTWPYYTTIDITSGTMARAFVFALYEDIADFFKEYAGSTKFSIGADEVQLSTSNLASGYSYKWGHSKFPGYINDLNTLLNNKGYTMRMYNDYMGSSNFTLAQFASNIEIMYWDSPFSQNNGNETGTNTVKASVLADQNRILYNCIQSNCYYVLRVANTSSVESDYKYMDARNPKNLNWSFNYATEQRIYETWTPNDFGEKGKYSTTDVVDDSNISGAYFLIWNDYPTVSTEAELWNGAPDNTGTNNGVTYYLLDRMASNIIKMWNWDINKTVDFDDFAAVRDTFGDFPGFTSCSADASLPAATAATKAYLADHTALTAALADVITEQGNYTDESWADYQAAIAAAKTVNANYGATEAELATALANLNAAKDALTEKTTETEPTDPTETPANNFTVTYKTKLSDETEKTVGTRGYYLSETATSFQIYLPPMIGYSFDHADNCTFVPLASGDGSGYLRGTNNGGNVVVWLKNEPTTSYLDTVLGIAPTEQGSYTAESWDVYQTALNAAKSVTADTQADIDAAVNALLAAQTALVQTSESKTAILKIEGLAGKNDDGNIIARQGKQVGLRITTTPDVAAINVIDKAGEAVTLTIHTGRVQTLENGTTVKIWLIGFPADEEGTFTYTVTAGTATQSITVKVQ